MRMLKQGTTVFFVTILIFLGTYNTGYAQAIDPPLSERTPQIRDTIVEAVPGVNNADDVTAAHLAAITSLNPAFTGITSLKSGDFNGLTALTYLNLSGNSIGDISVLEDLTTLTSLFLAATSISDISALESLTALKELYLTHNAISDISVLQHLTALTELSLGENSVSNISVLQHLTALKTLILDHNAISDVSVLENLTTLEFLSLNKNPISDYGPLRRLIAAVKAAGRSLTLDITIPPEFHEDNDPKGVVVESPASSPVFTEGTTATRTVAENTAASVNIGSTVAATDADNDTLIYTLSGTDASSFSILSTSGQLQTKAALDFETKSSYSVTVEVSDGNGGSTSIAVTINVSDVNEAPVFSQSTHATLSVAEQTASGRNIGVAFTATDPDSGDTLTYSLRRGDRNSFRIDPNTGQLQTRAALDYETKRSYNDLAVRVTDSGGLTDAIVVTINVTDVDENRAPSFTDGSTTTRSVAENTGSGEDIGRAVAATDPDDDTLTYTLGGADAASFRIDNTNGQLRTQAALDYESDASYSLTVSVSDGNGSSDSIDVTISVTNVNEAPSFTEGSTATRSIAENTASGTNIGTAVAATDVDANTTLTYTLGGADAAAFRINSTNGRLKTRAALDYETKTSYSVTITVSDSELTDTIDVTINVTDVDENRAPSFTEGNRATRSVAENTDSGQNIGSAVAATDPDTDDTLTYTLGGTDAAAFSIVSTSGQLRTRGALDYETKTSYSVTVSVSDGNGSSDSLDVTINVMNVNEAPSFANSTATRSIAENTAANTNIGTAISATDPDTGDTLTYTLGGADAAAFRINSTNGRLKTRAALDYETKTSYTVTITVSDSKLTDTIDVTINVTDVDENRAPSFADGTSTTRSIAENTAADTNIGSAVSATDPDDDTLTYTLSGTDAAAFSIVSTSGQLQTNAALDYETKSSYSVTVSVSDGNGGSDSISVNVNVTDVDENRAPVFTEGDSTTRSIAENTDSGTNIGEAVAATDADSDTLTYTLGSTDAASFSIVSTSGQLQTKAPLDYETKSSYSLTVSVSDGNGGTDSTAVTINVTDVDETPINLPVSERTPQVRDAIVAAVPGVNNAADVTEAHLAAITSLNLDTKSITSLKVGDFGGLTNLTQLLLGNNVLTSLPSGIFDELKNLGRIILSRNVLTSLPSGIFDELKNLKEIFLSRNVLTSLPSGIFDELKNLRLLYVGNNVLTSLPSGIFDELKNLTVIGISDNALTSLPSGVFDELKKLKKIALSRNAFTSLPSGIFDEPKKLEEIFLGGNTLSTLPSGVFDGLTKLNMLSLDNNALTSLPSGIFDDLSSLTQLWLARNKIGDFSALEGLTSLEVLYLSYNPISDYGPLRRLKVAIGVIEDHPGLPLDITIPAVANNNVPVFTDGDSTTRSIAENTDSGTNIGTAVAATDADTADTLTYHLGGTDASSFRIVRTSGQLQTNAALDHETKNSYTVTVAVSDGRGGSDSITVTITVTDVIGAAPSVQTPPALPDTTALLSNFPNPFNPETWIPYQLAEPAAVTITIYDVRGRVVRTLVLGNQPAGMYRSRSKAAHWDGRNHLGEQVATGVYFYTLKAGDYAATRKLLIRK